MAATKIDYVALASAIRKQLSALDSEEWIDPMSRAIAKDTYEELAWSMAVHFSRTNKKFDSRKFYKDCGLF